jgi:hypothetical protein
MDRGREIEMAKDDQSAGDGVMNAAFSIDMFVPQGVLPDDHWHLMTYDETCSRCRKPVPEDENPLIIWSGCGNNMLVYCDQCARWKR